MKLSILDRLASRHDGKVVIVTAITPTKAGEGKTTTSISLTQGLGKIGKKVMLALREPSMGPVFGVKGGGTGGGYAQVAPMEEINLHFNGDFHAVTAAHSLLAAALDASIYNGNPLRIDPASVSWPRTVDMNDRELRYTVVGLGGKTHGIPRENEFVITAASEIMAIFALASDVKDLRQRLGRIVVASTYDGEPVTAEMLRAAGAMTVIMKDAIKPNIVQTLEGQPALDPRGPVRQHRARQQLDHRRPHRDQARRLHRHRSGLRERPRHAEVLRHRVPHRRVRADRPRCSSRPCARRSRTAANRSTCSRTKTSTRFARAWTISPRTSRSSSEYGLPCVVAINSFPTDSAKEIALLKELALKAGAETVVPHNGFGQGGAGAVDLAHAVVAACEKPNTFAFLTPPGTPIVQQIEAIATRLYGAAGIDLQMQAQKDLAKLEKLGMSTAPVCVAKTQMSLSHDPALRNRPTGFIVPVRALLPSAGAGFVVALCGDMQRMPGLGKTPAFQNIDIDAQGRTIGLF